MADVDVLIVGAGPAGVTLALELALQSVHFRLVDKEPTRSDKSRSLVVQPRSQELLNRHGAAEALVSRGGSISGLAFIANGKRSGSLELSGIRRQDTRFSSPLVISQCETETFLDGCLAKYGYKAERPVTVKEVVQDQDGVKVTAQNAKGDVEVIRAKYVVGCDGAHSVVRHASPRFGFKGAAYPQDFLMCDAHIKDSNLDMTRLTLAMGKGVFALFPLDTHVVRLIAAGTGITSEEEPRLEDFQQLLSTMTPLEGGTLYDPIWLTRFHLHHRGVDTYRDRRLFVAGDAAHIHSPAGGQGMNTGMQDSINLGWKLARVLQGKAGDALLDSYHAERHPVGQRLLTTTDRAFSFVASMNWLLTATRNFLAPWVLPWVTSSKYVTEAAYGFLSEFDVTYRGTSMVGTGPGFKGSLRGGDRLPDAKLRRFKDGEETYLQQICAGPLYHLILFAGVEEASVWDEIDSVRSKVLELTQDDAYVHVIHANDASQNATDYYDLEGKVHRQFGFAKAGYIYVRPDGYIGYIGLLSKMDAFLSFVQSQVQQ